MQKGCCFLRENDSRADGRESLQEHYHTQGCWNDACDTGAQAHMGFADGSRAKGHLLSIDSTRSLCDVSSKESVRAARGLPNAALPAKAAGHWRTSAHWVLLLWERAGWLHGQPFVSAIKRKWLLFDVHLWRPAVSYVWTALRTLWALG